MFILPVVTIGIVIIVAISVISRTRLLWTDFIIVCVVLSLQFVVVEAIPVYEARKSGANVIKEQKCYEKLP